MPMMLSALRAGHTLTPEIYSDTHFCYKLNEPQAMVRLEGLGTLKNSSGLIGNNP
jgi:hypothetical protein